ncbi:hypothetical protein F4677DRAFT_429553 [Hypoxylon crocopeplum]|nr:hypothetical protein F4677DRAFT_429553 [Hypoxylon crocopeplum]
MGSEASRYTRGIAAVMPSPTIVKTEGKAADDPATSPPGFGAEVVVQTVFEFSIALDFVKKKLHNDSLRDHWADSIADAVDLCIDQRSYVHLSTSMSWFSIKFLDVLWSLLFGRIAGLSPWDNSFAKLKRKETNSSDDELINPRDLSRRISSRRRDAETIVRNFMERYPTKIRIPEIVPVTPSASGSIEMPKIKRRRTEL